MILKIPTNFGQYDTLFELSSKYKVVSYFLWGVYYY